MSGGRYAFAAAEKIPVEDLVIPREGKHRSSGKRKSAYDEYLSDP